MADEITPLEIQANRLDMLSRLAGDLSHEIKNPLHAIVINLELVRRRVAQGEADTALERVGVVEEEIKRVHELVHALLEALRPPRNSTQSADAARVLHEMMPLLRTRARLARVEMDAELALDSVTVALPPHLLRQLILNLLDRAVRHAGTGGSVSLTSSGRDGLELVVNDAPAPDGAAADTVPDLDQGLRVTRALTERAGGELTLRDGDAAAGGAITLRLPRTATS